MASLMQKNVGKYKYWYIVESRRVNGKPRPVVLAYLGTADALLLKLQGMAAATEVKSWSHGAAAALLQLAAQLRIPTLINGHVSASRGYMAGKPVRNDLTAGMTLVLGAIGMACAPASKRGWWPWAKTTSLEYLLRRGLSKVDSQHFWDLMDALPVEAIEKIEGELLARVREAFALESDTLYYDTTNFFTFIATDNEHCTLAQRGKNKQKRGDLRQVGLALAVTPGDFVPVFHLTYQGNRADSKVFKEVLGRIKARMGALGMDLETHTLVFDRGNNSRDNMALVAQCGMHYVGALTPSQHLKILAEAEPCLAAGPPEGREMAVYRARKNIWGQERTVLLFVSGKLKAGQWRGACQSLEKKRAQLQEIQQSLEKPGKKAPALAALTARIEAIVKGQFLTGIIEWELKEKDGRTRLHYRVNEEKFQALEESLGIRMLMTDRHDWSDEKIIQAFYGQSFVEHAFKNIKNPYHLTLKPQHHWTDQKIRVHYFICILGYLMSTLLWKQAREKAGYAGTLDNLLDTLNGIRLAAIIEAGKGRGKPKVAYQLEQLDPEQEKLVQALGIEDTHRNRPEIEGVGVYAS